MLERSPKTQLGSAVIPFLNSWLCMMMMPACAPIDQTVLVHALHRTQGKVQLLNNNIIDFFLPVFVCVLVQLSVV